MSKYTSINNEHETKKVAQVWRIMCKSDDISKVYWWEEGYLIFGVFIRTERAERSDGNFTWLDATHDFGLAKSRMRERMNKVAVTRGVKEREKHAKVYAMDMEEYDD